MLGEAFQDPNRPIAAEMAKASRTGDIELMQNILHRNQNIIKRLLDNAVSAAIDARQVDVLDFLLRTGASIEMTGGIQARTAISRHSIPILSKMYDFGWRPDHVSIICAVIENDDEILEWLIEHGAKPTNGAGLETAAERGTTRQIDILLAAGARLTDTNPLHMAAGSARVYPGRMEMMAHLVNVGCDVNAWDSALPAREQRGTALCYACRSGNVEAARWLLEHGADQSYKKFGKFLTIQGTELIRSPGVLQQLEALLDKYEDASEWTYEADEGVWRGSSWL